MWFPSFSSPFSFTDPGLHARIFAHAREGMAITDRAGRIVDVNPAFTALTGYARDEVIGRSPSLLKSDMQDGAYYVEMWRALTASGHWQGDIWNRKKSGELYAERLSISALRDAAGMVTHYVAIFSDITSDKESRRQLESLAFFDPLTRLPNRALLADRLQQGLAQARRHDELLGVCYLDLDDFKPVNDRYGHGAGDNLLVEVASRLLATVRSGDTVARVGGDEFVLLFPCLRSEQRFFELLERIRSALAAECAIAGRPFTLCASIGHALFPADGDTPDVLLEQADLAMYAAKQAGKSRHATTAPDRHRRGISIDMSGLRFAI